MALLLRRLDNRTWFEEEGASLPWLDKGGVRGDALKNMKTTDNKLSFYRVENDKSNLHRVVAAVASTRDNVQVFDYAVLDEEHFSGLDVVVEKTRGNTPCDGVNDLHCEFVELSADMVLTLTKAIVAKAHIDRITYKQVYGHITAALGSHDMAEDRLRDGLKKNLRELAAKYRAIP